MCFSELNINEFGYPYKFSIVMAVYNVELFLEEAIDSIIAQTFDFQKYVQLILVNDGSADQSGAICDEYKMRYPENIIVIHKENGGVSTARNEGLKYIKGQYINFMDSDDKLSINTLEEVDSFFGLYGDSIDLVTIPLVFFDGKEGNHVLNNKFHSGSRVIYLDREYNLPLLSLSASFLKIQRARTMIFDKDLSFAEDAKCVLQLLEEEPKYGVVSTAKYYYRKRSSGTESATQCSMYDPKWYINYIQLFSLWAIDEYQKRWGYIPKFVQYTLLYHLQWHILQPFIPKGVLTDKEKSNFQSSLKYLLTFIDDSIIMEQKDLDIEHKYNLLSNKYGKSPEQEYRQKDIRYYYGDTHVAFMSNLVTKIEFIELENNCITIEGYFLHFNEFENSWDVYLSVNEELYSCELVERDISGYSLGQRIYVGIGFKGKIKFDPKENYSIQLVTILGNHLVERKSINFSRFAPLNSSFQRAYYYRKGISLSYRSGTFLLQPCKLLSHLVYELRWLKEIIRKKQPGYKKALLLRPILHVCSFVPRKETWLISDRIEKAGDNGEALFKYIHNQKRKSVNCFFAISPDSKDFNRLKQYGKVIVLGGWKYKWHCLRGAKIVSSQADHITTYPFADISHYYSDFLLKDKFIFLQHGITKDDVSKWLNKYMQNISLLITATYPEYRSFFHYNYYYDDKVIKLTGFPRYDYLYNERKKIITIIPTWRAYLISNLSSLTVSRKVISGFEETQYYSMYSKLFENRQLKRAAKEYGFEFNFMCHPNMIDTLRYFKLEGFINILSNDTPYNKIFAESSLLVTDYSSVAFDFAYLRKPVLYYQVDNNEFFSGSHSYDKGYFEYENDGFGEVLYKAEELVECLIGYMKNDCELKAKYKERIEETFPFSDKNSSSRVFGEIAKL